MKNKIILTALTFIISIGSYGVELDTIQDSPSILDAIDAIQTSVEASGNFELYEGKSYYNGRGFDNCQQSSANEALSQLQNLAKDTGLSAEVYKQMGIDFKAVLGSGKYIKCFSTFSIPYYYVELTQYQNLNTSYKINFEVSSEN